MPLLQNCSQNSGTYILLSEVADPDSAKWLAASSEDSEHKHATHTKMCTLSVVDVVSCIAFKLDIT